MPPTLSSEQIQGSQLDVSSTFSRYVSRRIVSGLDVVSGDLLALSKSLIVAGMPQRGAAHPSIQNCKCVRHVVRGMAGDQAAVDVIYETPAGPGGAPFATYVIEDSIGSQTEMVQMTHLFEPLFVQVTRDSITTKKVATVPRLTPIRRLVARGIVEGRPGAAVAACIDRVNSIAWMGYPKGYWLDAATDDLSNTYRVSAEFISRVNRPWREYSFFQEANGDYPSELFQNVQAVKNAMNATYTPGTYPYGFGFAYHDLYPVANFDAVFGIYVP
jgi:hypothetical protein